MKNILIFGLGSIGQRHILNLKRIFKKDIKIFIYKTTNEDFVINHNKKTILKKSFVKKYNLVQIKTLNNLNKLDINFAIIANNSVDHFKFLKILLLNKIFVFVEKPVCTNMKQLKELIKIEKLFLKKEYTRVAFQLRYHPYISKIKRILEKKILGNIVFANFTNSEYMPNWHPYQKYTKSYAGKKNKGGGALLTQIHDFDLAIFLFGKYTQIEGTIGKFSDLKIDVEDTVSCIVKFKNKLNNMICNINLNYLGHPPKKNIYIVGDKGSIDLDLISNEMKMNLISNNQTKLYKLRNFKRNDMYLDELKDFINFIKHKSNHTISLSEASKSLEIVKQLNKSK